MSLYELAGLAEFIDLYMRLDKHAESKQRELEEIQARTNAKLDAMPLPTTHIPMPVNPVSQEDGE